MKFLLENKKVLAGLIVLVIFFFLLIGNGVRMWKNGEMSEGSTPETEGTLEVANQPEVNEGLVNEEYQRLLANQEVYELYYGKVPDGFLWVQGGELLSVGDPNMTAEEAMYAFFQGLSSLDFGTAQRYSRYSKVVQTYSEYFDSSNKNTDYYDQFFRNMYREVLLSLQVGDVLNSSVFAENKIVFTVNARILDLTDKDFWREDEMEIFRSLYVYNLEDDSAAADMYLYDYILSYYRSGKASLRDVTFDITCERFADVNSGWLVSVDTDVDSACRYKDGNIIVSYIRSEYSDRGKELVDRERNPEKYGITESSEVIIDLPEGQSLGNGQTSQTQVQTENKKIQDLGVVDINNSQSIGFDSDTSETKSNTQQSETSGETGSRNYTDWLESHGSERETDDGLTDEERNSPEYDEDFKKFWSTIVG